MAPSGLPSVFPQFQSMMPLLGLASRSLQRLNHHILQFCGSNCVCWSLAQQTKVGSRYVCVFITTVSNHCICFRDDFTLTRVYKQHLKRVCLSFKAHNWHLGPVPLSVPQICLSLVKSPPHCLSVPHFCLCTAEGNSTVPDKTLEISYTESRN